ncbi:MAG TPA: GNAT family N-acetyltransferase [Herpetosiphonaceae bacterium]
MNLELIEPSERYAASYLAGMAELQAEGRHTGLDLAQVAAEFPRYLAELRLRADQRRLPPEKVAESVWWAVADGAWAGRVSFRHELNERLARFGGHVGYEIRPSARRRGYGAAALALALERIRPLGYRRVLLTCDEANQASRRIIERNGGRLEAIARLPDYPAPICRYWIDLAP